MAAGRTLIATIDADTAHPVWAICILEHIGGAAVLEISIANFPPFIILASERGNRLQIGKALEQAYGIWR
jgi:hypothetical protein